MSGSDWIVLAIAAAAIGWVNWYFFFAASTSRADRRAPQHRSSSKREESWAE